ncbi:hypothetical protein QHH_10 [Halomonas phage QHHSV-1]|nr:hypothetical protein QHH_10 [Halomonas phage QHHSV-1]
MTITTVETALCDLGARLCRAEIAQAARRALAEGDQFEVEIRLAVKPQGISATLTTRAASPATSHGRLIRLS